METIIIRTATKNTPEVIVQEEPPFTKLIIKGRLLVPEGEIDNDFFNNLSERLESLDFSTIHVKMEYIDSSARESLAKLLRKLIKEEKEQLIYWHYEEDDEAIERQADHYHKRLPHYVFIKIPHLILKDKERKRRE
ncbi:SiaC family regulatory phosphoprotein [Candidatus Woesearchaeota archaeon]|nr:SiaC family regulatory phosphoprotein [Candidatus Woesearchaeota archaeon]